jgi:hypothetical protein
MRAILAFGDDGKPAHGRGPAEAGMNTPRAENGQSLVDRTSKPRRPMRERLLTIEVLERHWRTRPGIRCAAVPANRFLTVGRECGDGIESLLIV